MSSWKLWSLQYRSTSAACKKNPATKGVGNNLKVKLLIVCSANTLVALHRRRSDGMPIALAASCSSCGTFWMVSSKLESIVNSMVAQSNASKEASDRLMSPVLSSCDWHSDTWRLYPDIPSYFKLCSLSGNNSAHMHVFWMSELCLHVSTHVSYMYMSYIANYQLMSKPDPQHFAHNNLIIFWLIPRIASFFFAEGVESAGKRRKVMRICSIGGWRTLSRDSAFT